MRVLVAGAGPVARALASALGRAGVEVGRWSRAIGADVDEERVAEVALLAVSDGAVGEVAERLLDQRRLSVAPVLLHTAGALPPSSAFAAVRGRVGGIGVLHPLRAFARDAEVADLAGTVFGIAGDEAGRAAALALAGALAGTPLLLDEESLPRYHAAAVLTSNHTLALVDAALSLLEHEGLDRAAATSALAALLHSAAENLSARGLPAALTGPISRGDDATVARHLAALPAALLPLYRATACATLDLARHQGRAPPESLARVAALLGCSGSDCPPRASPDVESPPRFK